MYSYEYDDERLVWVVIKWEVPINGTRIGTVVFKDSLQANTAAMCEEMQYEAMCHEWALNNNQESEFDYVWSPDGWSGMY